MLTKADGESYTPGTWSNQGLYVDYVCEDNPGGSGIAFDNYNAAVDWTFDEGADQSHTAAGSGCVDNAGNEADPLTLSEINVDSTAPDPTVAFRQVSASETHTADGGTMVSFSPQFVDDVGVVEESCDPASGSLFPTGLSLATCWATDPAGNTGTSSFEIFVRDDSPPVLTGSLVTPPYANRSTPVTISVTVTDNVGVALVSTWASFGPRLIGRDFSGYCTPGLETLPTTTTCTVTELIPPLSPEGEYAIWMTAEDAAVNVGTTEPTTHQLFVDFTKPTITAVLTKADGDSYIPGTWSNQSVNVDYVCADSPGGSGIATDDYAAAVDWTFDEGADQSHTAAGSGCVDLAGNEADPLIVDDIDVDLTPPNPTVAFKRVSASETHTADGGTAVSFSPEFVDDAGIVEESCDPASGSLFPTRLSVATCWATDPAGNTGTSSFEIFVRDDSPPVLTDSLVTPSYANRSTPVTISVTVTDNVGVALVSTWASFGPRLIGRDFSGYCTPGLETAPTSTTCTVTELIPPLSPEGEYAIWMTAEDAAVNVGTTEPTTHQLFVDFTKPTITAVLTKADGDSYIPGTWSNQSVNVDYICTDSPGGSGIDMDDYAAAVDWTFDEGADQSHTAAGSGCVDLAGNEADPLVVSDIDVDLTAPTIVQAPIRVSASATHTADDGTVVTFTPEVMDNEDVGLVASCEPASGTRFALGATGVNCEATDSAGNTGTHFFNVRVWDESPPVLTNSSVTPRYANASTLVTMTVTVTDNVGVDLVLVLGQVGELVIERNLSPFCNPSLDLTPTSTTCAATLMVPSQLPEGDYTLWMMAYDRGNNEGTTVPTSHMLFYDVTKPTITAVLTKADGESYTPGTWSNQSVNVDYVCADSPGGSGIAMDDYAAAVDWTFGEGADQSHTAAGSGCVDLAGNEADPLVVSDIDVDQTAPILTNIPQNQAVIESITGGGMVVDYPLPTAIDTVDLFPEVSCAPQSGSLFPLGDTPVTCTATDDSGNQALAGFVITVLTPAEAVIALLDHIEDSVGESSVAAPLKQIAKLLQDGNTTNDGAVCNKLTAFIGIVETKRDQGRLSDLEAQDLITSATEIMASVGCQMSGS